MAGDVFSGLLLVPAVVGAATVHGVVHTMIEIIPAVGMIPSAADCIKHTAMFKQKHCCTQWLHLIINSHNNDNNSPVKNKVWPNGC